MLRAGSLELLLSLLFFLALSFSLSWDTFLYPFSLYYNTNFTFSAHYCHIFRTLPPPYSFTFIPSIALL
ncbi:hypothetical protein BOTBODRAFT_514553 [Botryobasidium botryosum FD-172 SS1]|uniref:Uncharacterized protein n=1 Tax=Botryobasidium botryosum (strain FD-172 SS1) TaxID=930990 RepID=A0A067N312_BOTB1|nr:hypothetical protein BOTBODRAFT_514553 [Botryobasidium botryosum FD-172 SS1]